jgi:ribose transport system ATP-binding protein
LETARPRPARRLLPRPGSAGAATGSAILAAVIVLLAHDEQAGSLTSMMTLLAALAFIGFGQLIVILTAHIDLSVGPLAGLLVVVASFFVLEEKGTGSVVPRVRSHARRRGRRGPRQRVVHPLRRFTPMAATLATYIALQGVSLLLRSEQGGFIRTDVTDAVNATVGTVPIAFAWPSHWAWRSTWPCGDALGPGAARRGLGSWDSSRSSRRGPTRSPAAAGLRRPQLGA